MASLDSFGSASGRVVQYPVTRRRRRIPSLMEMGLLEGEEIEVIGFAPLGDPIEIRLRDYRLSLRRS